MSPSSKPRKSPRKSAKSSRRSVRPKRSTRKAKPTRGARRPARSSKPQRKAKAPVRKAAKAAKAARSPAKSAPRKAALRPAAAKPRDATKKAGLRIVLFGAGGMVGSRIAKEALSRGHDVVAVQRNAGGLDLDGRHVLTVQGDATDPGSVATLARGCDAIVSAISPRGMGGEGSLAKAARALLEGSRKSGTKRLVVVGGAGSLSVAPGTMLVDSKQFPNEYKPEAREHVAALNVYRGQGQGVDWTFVSPAAMISPGKRTGKYQIGHDEVLLGKDGQSQISAEDYAVALVDEVERGDNKGRRMAVAWP